MQNQPGDTVHLAVPHGRRPCRRDPAGIKIHQRTDLTHEFRQGLPVVPIGATLVDLADVLPVDDLRMVVCEAVDRRLVASRDLTELAAGRTPRSFALAVEEVAAGARSGGEGAYWRALKEARLPLPELNAAVHTAHGRYLVDALWAELRLGVEIDGRAVHARRQAFEADRVRQNHLHLHGIQLFRFPVSLILLDRAAAVRQTREALRVRAIELGIPWQ